VYECGVEGERNYSLDLTKCVGAELCRVYFCGKISLFLFKPQKCLNDLNVCKNPTLSRYNFYYSI
jgi:hypothetical protein